jgi:uncharacterized membrane protein
METKSWAIFLVVFCALLGSLAQLLFKSGSYSVKLNLLSWVTNFRICGGMALYGLSAILFIVALKYGNLSVLYPVIATSYIWVMLFSNKFLGEPVSITNWLGVAFILSGIILIVRR